MINEKTISTKYLKYYRYFLILFISTMVLLYSFQAFMMNGFLGIALGLSYAVLFFMVYLPRVNKLMKSLKQISYDHEYLYVHEADQQLMLPLSRIKIVELTSLDGLYKFNLMDEQHFGKELYCKTSMWYPFNYKKVDKDLDFIRYLIKKAKERSYPITNNNILTSNTPQ
jgi:hypothetical protein